MGTHAQLPAGRLHNNLKALRRRLGLNQQELARRAGVTRQTISGVESGLYLPSTLVALRLAKALGCRVEDLLWLEEETTSLDVVPAAAVPMGCASRLLLARVGNRWIAHPLCGEQTMRTELLPADAEGYLFLSNGLPPPNCGTTTMREERVESGDHAPFLSRR